MGIKTIIAVILIVMPLTSYGLTVDEWLVLYKRPCANVKVNQVCRGRLNRSLLRMKNSIVPELLKKNGLPLWLSTIGIVESDYNNDAVSKAGAVGALQVSPYNIQSFFTKKEIKKGVRIYSGKLKFTETIIETKPTIESCRWLGKDPKINAEVAIWLLKDLYGRYKNWRLALLAYNSGQPRIDAYLRGEGKPLTFETLNYYQQLLAIQRYMEEKG